MKARVWIPAVHLINTIYPKDIFLAFLSLETTYI